MNRKGILLVFVATVACAVQAHDIIPTPQSYAEGEGFNANGKIEHVTDKAIAAEGYALSVTPEKIVITASDDAGRFYAAQTLGQMKTERGYPVAEVKDAPRFGWRGIMVDESRHFFGKEAIKKLIGLMARYKLNVFHWHLNDEGGFRQPFDFDPKMAKEGATRPFNRMLDVKSKTDWDPDQNVEQKTKLSDGNVSGPAYGPYSYTKDEIREVLAFAAAHHVRVIPELEIPGHARGLLRAHPDFVCVDGQGKPFDIEACSEICVGNPDTMAWYDRAFDETFDLFPDATVHIGGDEVSPKRWNVCPKCRAFREKHGLRTWQEQQAWVTRHVWERARARGKRIIGWGPLYYQHAPTNAIICCAYETRMACAAMEGYDIVRTDCKIYNFDWSQGLRDDSYQYIAWKPHISTFEDVWSEHVSCELPEDRRHHVLGVIAACWSEFIRTPDDLEWKVWPRALALSDSLWKHGGDPISGRFPDFRRRTLKHIRWLREQGVNCAPLNDLY